MLQEHRDTNEAIYHLLEEYLHLSRTGNFQRDIETELSNDLYPLGEVLVKKDEKIQNESDSMLVVFILEL